MDELYDLTAKFGDRFTVVEADLNDVDSMTDAFTEIERVIYIEPQKPLKVNKGKDDTLSGYRSKLLNKARIMEARIEELRAKVAQGKVLKACSSAGV